MKKVLNFFRNWIFNLRIPKYIKANYRNIDKENLNFLKEILISEYFNNVHYSEGVTAKSYLSTDEGKLDLYMHLLGRLEGFRRSVILWLCSIKNLKNSKILEIGCGTGSSTLALAEQGAEVIGIDIDEPSLRVAKKRSILYNVHYDVINKNATSIEQFDKGYFDIIIFFASLEHMTLDERIESIRKAWEILPPNGLIVVIETPNRLWFRDDHTSLLPFFHWLPDQLGFYYSHKSPRTNFYNFSNISTKNIPESFFRLGRGVSFHEFELAIDKKAITDNVVGDLNSFLSNFSLNPITKIKRIFSLEKRYHNFLTKIGKNIANSAFFYSELNLAIVKRKN